MAKHTVTIEIVKKKLNYDKHCLHVDQGDEIAWKVKDAPPFAVIVKAFVSPLDWSYAVKGKDRKSIVGTVRSDAEPGFYPYGVCVIDGPDLIVDDPEIIVKPPKGGK
jgi:plastocyanin